MGKRKPVAAGPQYQIKTADNTLGHQRRYAGESKKKRSLITTKLFLGFAPEEKS